MKIALILFTCLVITISADRVRIPEFVVRDGKLIRNDAHNSTVPENSKILFTIRNSKIDGRIVGGSDAIAFSAPWMISLQWGTIRPSHFCGGALISLNWVKSAAHCAQAYPEYEQIRQVERDQIVVHEEWSGYVGPHDISLIFTARPFEERFGTSPFAIPDQGEIHFGYAILHGWGSTSTGFIPEWPTVLQTIEKPIVEYDTCRPLVEDQNMPIDDNNLCTGPLEGGASACSGDSGSPLTQSNELIGIVAWNYIPCGQPNRPSVYIRISAYIPWINERLYPTK